jgi:hypothetical protein
MDLGFNHCSFPDDDRLVGYSLVETGRRFKGAYCLHHQGVYGGSGWVSRRPLTAKARVRARASPCGDL